MQRRLEEISLKKIAVFILSMIMMTAIVMACPLAQSNVANLADNSNVLVVYFSCTKTTEGVAKGIQAEYLETIHQEMNSGAENGADFSEAESKSELAQEITLMPQG